MSMASWVYPALSIVQMLTQGSKNKETVDKYDELRSQIDNLQAHIGVSPSTFNMPVNPLPVSLAAAGNTGTIKTLTDDMIDISKSLDESLRFARDDSTDHPEVHLRVHSAKRIAKDLGDKILTIERYGLQPKNIVSMSPDEKKVVDHVLPKIRKLRQQIINGAGTTTEIEQSAAMANEIATQLKVAQAVIAQKAKSQPYSRYAPTMTVDTGCIECGRAHIALADIMLNEATNLAQTTGFASPQVQSKITKAEEELSAMLEYDWSKNKIDRTNEKERSVLVEYQPKMNEIKNRIGNLSSVEELSALSSIMTDTRNTFSKAIGG